MSSTDARNCDLDPYIAWVHPDWPWELSSAEEPGYIQVAIVPMDPSAPLANIVTLTDGEVVAKHAVRVSHGTPILSDFNPETLTAGPGMDYMRWFVVRSAVQ